MSLQSTNWQAHINDAVARGDMQSAAVFEQQRNAKIASPDYKGSQTQTNLYSQYLNNGADLLASIKGIAQANSAYNAEQAEVLRDWQVEQNAKAMDFNASEAAKSRAWQEMMSNTAHQREIADLRAAGLNPVLSAMGGNGAAVTSGATASGVTSAGAKGEADTAVSGAIANLLGTFISTQTQLQAANINARTQEAVADKYTAMERIVAQIQSATSMYGADKQYQIHKDFPSNEIQAISSIVQALAGNMTTVSSAVDKAKDKVNNIVGEAKDKLSDSGIVKFFKALFADPNEN